MNTGKGFEPWDESAFNSLESLKPWVFRQWGIQDGQDAYQDLWIKFLSRRSAVKSPRAWGSKALRHVCYDRQRRERFRRHQPLEKEQEPVSLDGNPLRILETRENVHHVRAALARLEPHRHLLDARHMQDQTARQIAENLGAPIETIRTQLKRAKEKAKEKMKRILCRSSREPGREPKP